MLFLTCGTIYDLPSYIINHGFASLLLRRTQVTFFAYFFSQTLTCAMAPSSSSVLHWLSPPPLFRTGSPLQHCFALALPSGTVSHWLHPPALFRTGSTLQHCFSLAPPSSTVSHWLYPPVLFHTGSTLQHCFKIRVYESVLIELINKVESLQNINKYILCITEITISLSIYTFAPNSMGGGVNLHHVSLKKCT